MSKKLFIVLTLSVAFITIIFVSMSQKYRKKVPLYMKEITEDFYIEESYDKYKLGRDAVYEVEMKDKSDYHFKKYLVQSIPKTDYNKLINLNSFDFNVLGKTCSNSTFILILIFSSPGNIKVRNTIRKSWAQNNKNVSTLFVLGSTENPTLQKAIIQEGYVFKDIIQGSVLDSDKNYIYKYVMSFKYALYHCSQAHFIVKTTDDIYVHVPILKQFLVRKFENCGSTDLIQCSTQGDHSNLYCTNHAVIFSWDVIFRLYQSAQESEFYGNHDAFLTGSLARKYNLRHKDTKKYIIDFNMLDDIIISNGIRGKRNFIFGPQDLDHHLMASLWDVIGHFDTSNVILPTDEC